MNIWTIFKKTMREQIREPLTLSLTLILPACFVLLYWLFFPGGGSTSYRILVLNSDLGAASSDGSMYSAGEILIGELQAVQYESGDPLLRVIEVEDRPSAESDLRNRDAALLLILPADFSLGVQNTLEGEDSTRTSILFVGDLTNPYYSVAAIFTSAGIENFIRIQTGTESPIQVFEEALGDSAGRSEFELYVPGMLIFAIIIQVFQAAMIIAAEVEGGTLRRLWISRLTAFEYLTGTSLALEVVGVCALLLSFLAARLLGFESQGPLWVAVLVGAICGLSIIGTGLIIAALSKTVSQAFLIANFPLVLFMFFSGSIYPIVKVPLFTLAGRSIGLYDILPPTHAVVALNKVLTLGMGLNDVLFEMGALVFLSLLYFALGIWLFNRAHMRPAV